MHFKAPWGRMLQWSSAIATVIILGAMPLISHAAASAAVPLEVLTLALVLGAVPFVVRGYVVTDDAILVQRLFWATRLPRETLTAVSLEPELCKGTVKTCGNGGLYSFTGWFYNKRIGHFRAFVTDWPRAVVLRFANRATCVVSPDNPQAFIAALGGLGAV